MNKLTQTKKGITTKNIFITNEEKDKSKAFTAVWVNAVTKSRKGFM